jgi:hypothetical protein
MAEKMPEDPKLLYLDLLKRALTGSIIDEEVEPAGMADDLSRAPRDVARRAVRKTLSAALGKAGFVLMKRKNVDPAARAEGRNWPWLAHTMIGRKRLDNIQACVEDVLKNGVPGDLIETGVWRGGSTIFMRGILKAYGVTDRLVWVSDSFAGLPPPDAKNPDDSVFRLHNVAYLAVSLEKVQEHFRRYGLLDDQVRFLKGFFSETLPTAPIGKLAVLRFDGDMYGSAMDVLNNLYDKLSPGGYLIVDDLFLPTCRKAVDDFRAARGIEEPIVAIDWTGGYWRKAR